MYQQLQVCDPTSAFYGEVGEYLYGGGGLLVLLFDGGDRPFRCCEAQNYDEDSLAIFRQAQLCENREARP